MRRHKSIPNYWVWLPFEEDYKVYRDAVLLWSSGQLADEKSIYTEEQLDDLISYRELFRSFCKNPICLN